MKILTDTEKWFDPWFRQLSPRLKLLWIYLCDRCRKSGVIEMDWETASHCIGEKVSPDDLKHFAKQVVPHPSEEGKLFIKTFVPFQFGKKINRDSTAYVTQSLIEAIDRDGVTKELAACFCSNGTAEPAKPKPMPRQNHAESPAPSGPQNYKPINGTVLPYSDVLSFKSRVGALFKRGPSDPWNYDEEFLMMETMRDRKSWRQELDSIEQYFAKSNGDPYRVQTLSRLLERWTATLDKARNFKEKSCL